MINILAGRGGLAARALITETARALASGGGAVYVVVPKQLTLQTELTLIRALEPGGSFRINVVSPERLCGRVFESAGHPGPERVDDRGRVMLARRAINALGDSLSVYAGMGHRRGFPARAARQLEIFRQAGFTPETLSEIADNQKGLLAAKLSDMSKLLGAYIDALGGSFMDGEAELLEAAARCGMSEVVKNSGMLFYGFDVMPRPLHMLIAALGAACDITLIFSADPDRQAPDANAYAPVNSSIDRLTGEAVRAGAPFTITNLDDTTGKIPENNAAISHIARQLFSARPAILEGGAEGVALVALPDPRSEAAYVAARCREAAMAGARYNEMLVLCGDIQAYARPLSDAFRAFDIPVFLSSSRPASRHALAEALLSALRLIWKGFTAEDALALLRTGYPGLTEADLLANYITRYAPKGRGLTEPFTRGDGAEAAEVQRQILINPVLALRAEIRAAKDLRGQLTAIFSYLTAIGAYETSLKRQQELADAGLFNLAGEESQVWNRLMSTLDEMFELMGKKRLSLEDINETLRESLDSAVIKPLPQSGDAVYAQSLDQAVSREARHVYIVGLSDRTYFSSEALLSDRQSAQLARASKKYLGPDGGEKALMRRYFLKTALYSARERLEFTYPLSSEDGAAQRPAAVVREIKRALPGLKEKGGVADDSWLTEMKLSAPGAALREIGACLDTPKGAGALAALYSAHSAAAARLLRAFDFAHASEQLNPLTARKLYGALSSASVTRLELFGKCPFAHFMRYALSPERVEPYELTVRDEGGFYHDAVRGFLADSMGDIGVISPDVADRRMDEISDALLSGLEDSLLMETSVARAEKRRLRATARSAAEALVNQLAGSKFSPVELEVEFGKNDGAAITLHTSGEPCYLEGRVDRVDEWRAPDENFLRVIDYKRGNTELRLCEAYYGLQLQLIVYLAAAMRRRGDAGAGVYYFKIDEGIVSDQSTDPDVISAKRRTGMRLNGLTLSDPDVVAAMSPRPDDVITIRINKDGTIGRTQTAVDADAFVLVINKALENAAAHVDGIRGGNVRAAPARTKKLDPCKFCQYNKACLFDETLDAAKVRRVMEMRNEEVLEKLRAEADGRAE